MTAFVFILGTFVGSFLNVVIYRLPRGEGFVWGHSRCPHCRRDLLWYELIPVVSFLVLRGSCRTCKTRLSFQYPIIELISGMLFVIAPSIPMVIVFAALLVLAVIDLQHFIIPDELVLVLAAMSFFLGVISWNHVASGIGAALFFFLLWAGSKGKWMGFGDIKLVGALGLIFGFPSILFVLYIAIVGGGILSVFLLLLKKARMKTVLPFGTILASAVILYVTFEPFFHTFFAKIFPL